eukprot:gb/GFBE01019491.1/.p1 GENE.gb/GFBE01019491.1/~~gb/GFBE01019491.1/.p1  ORF type:complete len:262 (+),score=37.08 gb/GFBE01019491.1/:1-786(+)
MSRLPRGRPAGAHQHAGSVADALRQQLQQPSVWPLRLQLTNAHPMESTRRHGRVSQGGEAGAMPSARKTRAPSKHPGNASAGVLAMLAVGTATLVTRWLEPSRPISLRRQRIFMARHFVNYSWEEAGKDGRELRVYIPVDDTVKPKHVEMELTENRLKVSINGQMPAIDADLNGTIDPEESFWFIEQRAGRRCVALTMTKKNMWERWQHLTCSEASGMKSRWIAKITFIFSSLLLWFSWSFIRAVIPIPAPLQLLQVSGHY